MILADGGIPLTIGGSVLTTPTFFDSFTRPDADTLGNGWRDWADTYTTYAPLGIRSNAVASYDPTDNTNTGEQSPGYPWDGISCASRQTGSVDAAVQLRATQLSNNYRECGPAFHFLAGTDEMCIAAWLTSPGPPGDQTAGFLFVGAITNPCSDFGDGTTNLAVSTLSFTRATSNVITGRSVNGELFLWVDGVNMPVAIVLGPDAPSGPIPSYPIPAHMQASTDHGFVIDTHFDLVNGDAPMISDVWLSPLDP